MLELILNLFKVGDTILIQRNDGSTIIGIILVLSNNAIALEKREGGKCVIKDEDIVFFEEQTPSSLDKPNEIHKERTNGAEVNIEEQPSPQKGEEVVETTNVVKKPSASITTYKPGDKIPMDVLRMIDPRVARFDKPHKEKKHKLSTIGKDLGALSKLVEEEHEIENNKYVPAIGEIKITHSERNFGFIIDAKTGKDIFFSISQVLDDELKKQLFPHTSVLYTIVSGDQGGNKAVAIHKPGKVKDLLSIVERLEKRREYRSALYVLDQILKEYPDNFTAEQLKKSIEKHLPNKEYRNSYWTAKKYHSEKNYDKAIEFYLHAIEDGQRVESSIKDLAMLYASLFKAVSKGDVEKRELLRQRAVNFMKECVDELPNSLSTYYFLENFYYSVFDFENFIKTVNVLVEEREVQKDKTKLSILLTKKAAVYIQQKKDYEAIDAINEALMIAPDNQAAINLKSVLDNPERRNDEFYLESLISATRFDTLTSGLSPFVEHLLSDYEEYAGVPAKIIESGKFDSVTLKGIRNLIDSFVGRSRERAKYLLTEGKLMRTIEPDNIIKLRSVMARYCNDMAKNHISDNSPLDIARFYYNEAFSLEESYDGTVMQISYYLLTYCYTYNQLLQATSRNIPVDKALEKTLEGSFDEKKWNGILSMFLNNREISARIISKIFRNPIFKSQAIEALKRFGIIFEGKTEESFADAWNRARENRLGEYKKTVISISSIKDNASIEEIVYHLTNNLRNERKEWLPSLDLRRITSIINNVSPAIATYIKSSGYRNKESNYNNVRGQIIELMEEIKNGPTKLSIEALYPLLERILEVLKDSFADVIKISAPRIEVKLLSEATVVDDNNIISLQIQVSNHKDSSPIREVSIKVSSSDKIQYIEEENTLYNAIEGGDSNIFKLKVRVGDEVIKKRAALLETTCHYKNGEEEYSRKVQLSLKLYSPEEHELIDNPYAPIADGGPVPIESNMFYGREVFISNIAESILNSPSKQIIIYGQKRCGKSSVMLHLKKKLQDTGKTFCIFFSIGDIIKNLSEVSFYYKILSKIKEELEFMEFNDIIVPDFNLPSFLEFRQEDDENPLNTFTKYMTRFKLLCKKTEGWEERNIVVMIDEFTYLYTEIKKGNISPSIMKQWKAVTQNERAQFSVVLVGQDVVPSFKKEDYARNAFGVIQDIRLTYLQLEPARDLVEKPILNKNGESRYIGNAVDKILEYTSRNPYYIQIFCARLVDFMNKNKSISVTEADVNEVAKSFVIGDQALEEDKFDNLIRAGETEDLQEFPEEQILMILRQIAICTKNVPYCNRSDIDTELSKECENQILKHLEDREVIERKGEDNYKIQVKLFQEWLLNH